MTDTHYAPPVDKLLTMGETDLMDPENWPDYLALGIGPEHIPDLLRMVVDEELNDPEAEGSEIWAPVHALRMLGQLRDESTIQPLLQILGDSQGNEWVEEEMPGVFGLIGPAAIPALSEYLADASHDEYTRGNAADALTNIADRHPESRTVSIQALTRTLEQYEVNGYDLNSFIIYDLARLKAVDTLPLIEKAFEAEMVEEFFIDLDYVLVLMGLKEPESELPSSFEELASRFLNLPTPKYNPSDFEIVNHGFPDDENAPIVDSLPVRASRPVREFKPIKFSRNKSKKKKKRR